MSCFLIGCLNSYSLVCSALLCPCVAPCVGAAATATVPACVAGNEGLPSPPPQVIKGWTEAMQLMVEGDKCAALFGFQF